MTYKNWKLMEEVTVAIKKEQGWRGFDGYVVESSDKNAVESATSWATVRPYDREKGGYQDPIAPDMHTFKNEGFTAKILDSAGGSSQGGRLSFWSAEVEKDGVKFTIGVNDAILADLIRNSHIVNGVVQEKVMFARKGGQPGLIHEGMDSYKDATADMKHKADMKSAKKTSKWEIGGIYSSITKTDICLGEAWDLYEEYQEVENEGYWHARTRTKLRKAKNPKKVYVWTWRYNDEKGTDFGKFLDKEFLDESRYLYFQTGKPPARAKTGQLKVTEADLKKIDKIFSLKEDTADYYDSQAQKIKGRYVRELKGK